MKNGIERRFVRRGNQDLIGDAAQKRLIGQFRWRALFLALGLLAVLIAWRYRPARPASVRCGAAGPVALAGAVHGEICARTGPWRQEGGWWRPGAWAVETWQVELTDGGLYQLSHDADGWWIDGGLD